MRALLLGLGVVLAACSGERFSGVSSSGGGNAGTGGSVASGGSAGASGAPGGGAAGSSGGSAGSGGSASGGTSGVGGAAGAGGAPCNGADLSSDAKNCGVCGHDCIETSCVKGECQAKVLITNVQPKGLAIDGSTLYFAEANSSTIRKMPSDGSGTATTFASGQSGATYLALDNGTLYWTRTSGQVMSQGLGSGAAVTVTNQVQNPLGIAVSGQKAYVAENGTGRLMTLPTGGGTLTQLAQMNTAQYIEGVATDGSKIWVAYNNGNSLVMLPMNGSSESPFATGQGGPSGVALDSDSVYWANQKAGEIRKKAKASAAHATLKTGLAWPVGIAVDDEFVYFAEGNAQRIARVAK